MLAALYSAGGSGVVRSASVAAPSQSAEALQKQYPAAASRAAHRAGRRAMTRTRPAAVRHPLCAAPLRVVSATCRTEPRSLSPSLTTNQQISSSWSTTWLDIFEVMSLDGNFSMGRILADWEKYVSQSLKRNKFCCLNDFTDSLKKGRSPVPCKMHWVGFHASKLPPI